jgi:hypothetical protein
MLHIYYRAVMKDRVEIRPPLFSKVDSLKNFIFCLKRFADYTFTMVCDGEIDLEMKQLVGDIGDIIVLPNVGNAESFWQAYLKALEKPSTHAAYFVEDDYIHLPDSLEKLHECLDELKEVDYLTLYDHPVRYASEYKFGLDLPLRNNSVYVTKTHHWRTVESTCMTFGARVSALQDDVAVFERYVKNRLVPQDRELFRRLQGLPNYEAGSNGKTLVGPIPSLATHCHKEWMAPLVDWARIVSETIN